MNIETKPTLADSITKQYARLGWSDASVMLPQPHAWRELAPLLDSVDVVSLIVPSEGCTLPARELFRVGVYYPVQGGWILPRQISPRLLILGELELSGRMALRAYVAGVRQIAWTNEKPPQSVPSLMASSGLRAVNRKLGFSKDSRGLSKKTHRFKLSGRPVAPASAFDPNRILMINSALAWGGAERQLVNTMIGLHTRGCDVQLVCEALNYVPDSDFFKWRLDQRGLKADTIRKDPTTYKNDCTPDMIDKVLSRTAALPAPVKDIIAPYALEMLARKPGVVHAWQDQTNIHAGIAAAIAGVPKIVLSTRNVSPSNFAYYQDHMPDAYRALLRLPNVRIINNSKAGAADYCSWLGKGEEKFDLLYNGIDFSDMKTPSAEETCALRQRLGLKGGRKVLGSIFRLYDEKDPFLWLETAIRVGEKLPDVDFVVFGVGPLQDELLDRMEEAGMKGRLHLPGTEKNPALALSVMDAFLLTSKFEGLPNVVIEAQSQGVPVVTTRAGGSAEALLHGETGWVVDERDPDLLAEKVCQALTASPWRHAATAKAQAFARERFGFDRMIDETIEIYGRVKQLR